MCGLAGYISFNNNFILDKDTFLKGTEYLKYRGPDHQSLYEEKNERYSLYFFHARLSIIDLSEDGNQPMTSISKNSTIVFNGEIYNYLTIKKALEKDGAQFKSRSDTEVMLAAYERWGIDKMLNELDGMFSFVLFDHRKEKTFLVRDRFGKKPLYYSQNHKGLFFSSDIRSFRHYLGQSLTIDMHALGYYFAELSTPEENSIWNEVKKIRPAHYLEFNNTGIINYKPYWEINYTLNCELSGREIQNETERLLTEAVKKRMIGDVPVSALLSGGIDSSLIVAKMAEQSSTRIKTYSVGFEDRNFNELPYARLVANKFETNHTELILKPANLMEINKIIEECGEPFADSSLLPTYLISKEISKKEKVVLGGDGGDELFAGYHSYYFAYKYDKIKKFKIFKGLSKKLNEIHSTYRTDFLYRLLQQTNKEPHELLNRGFGFDLNELVNLYNNPDFYRSLENEHRNIWSRFKQTENCDLINVISSSLHTRLGNDYLVKVDRASMFASLEIRSPFLDKGLADFSATLKPDQLYKPYGPKSVLKSIANKYFPDSFINRTKMGFGIPIGQWFKEELNHTLREVVLGGKQNLVPFNYGFIEKLIDEHETGKADHVHKIWALYVFHIWAQAS